MNPWPVRSNYEWAYNWVRSINFCRTSAFNFLGSLTIPPSMTCTSNHSGDPILLHTPDFDALDPCWTLTQTILNIQLQPISLLKKTRDHINFSRPGTPCWPCPSARPCSGWRRCLSAERDPKRPQRTWKCDTTRLGSPLFGATLAGIPSGQLWIMENHNFWIFLIGKSTRNGNIQ